MTNPAPPPPPGGGDQPRVAGGGAPMGSGRRQSAAAAADLAAMARSSAEYKRNMQDAARAAKETTTELQRQRRGGLGPLGGQALRDAVNGLGQGAPAARNLGGNVRFGGQAAVRTQAGGSGGLVPPSTSVVRANGGGPNVPAPRGNGGLQRQVFEGEVIDGPRSSARRALGGGANFGAGWGYQQPLGGGANVPPPPSATGAPAAAMGPGELYDYKPVPAPNGGLRRAIPAAAAGVLGGAAGAFNNANMIQNDYIANRAALSMAGPYNLTAASRLLNTSFRGAFSSPAQLTQIAQPLLNSGGFALGTSGFATLAGNAQMAGRLDPNRTPEQNAEAAMTGQNPEFFNRLRMMTGVETIGRGGVPRDMGSVAQDLVRALGGPRTPMTINQVRATFGEGEGGLRHQLEAAQAPEAYIQAMQNYLVESSRHRQYPSTSQVGTAGTGLPGALGRTDIRSTDTMAGTQQTREGAAHAVRTEVLEPLSTEFKRFNDTISTGMQAVADAISENTSTLGAAADALARIAGGTQAVTQGALGSAAAGAAGGLIAGAVGAGVGSVGTRIVRGLLGRRRGGPRPPGNPGRLGRLARLGLRGIPFVGAAAGAAFAVRNADYSGDYLSDAGNIALNFASLGMMGGAEGDGVGHRPRQSGDGLGTKPSFGYAGWQGIGAAQTPGTGDGEGGGRGPATTDTLKKLLRESGLPFKISSEYRAGSRTTSGNLSYHATRNALDITGPSGGRDTQEMLAINKYLARKLGAGAVELIYSGPGAVNLNRGRPHSYNTRIRAMHHDHVHVAATAESLKKIGQAVTGQAEEVSSGDGTPASRRKGKGYRRKENARSRYRQQNGFSEKQLISDIFRSVTRNLGRLRMSDPDAVDLSEGKAPGTPNGKGASGGATGGNAGESAGISQIEKFMAGIRQHESSNDYGAENPTSSASGAYQYLTSTWGNYKGYRTAGSAPPEVQDERARKDYTNYYNKYKNWRLVAAAHFRGSGWADKNKDNPNAWALKAPGVNPTTAAFVESVLSKGGIPQTGDGHGHGAGDGIGHGALTTAEPVRALPPDPNDAPRPRGGRGGGGQAVMVKQGGSISIGRVEVHMHGVERVSDAELRRIGARVADEIARQTRMTVLAR